MRRVFHYVLSHRGRPVAYVPVEGYSEGSWVADLLHETLCACSVTVRVLAEGEEAPDTPICCELDTTRDEGGLRPTLLNGEKLEASCRTKNKTLVNAVAADIESRNERFNAAVERTNNVFADLGFDNAEELQAKAEVMSDIEKLLEDLPDMSESDISELLLVSEESLLDLLRCRLHRFTIGELKHFRSTIERYLAEIQPVKTTLSAENARRFIEIMERDDGLSEEAKERLRVGLKRSAAAKTSVLDSTELETGEE